MAVTFLNNLTGKLQNAGSSLANALFGSANISSTGGGQYPAGIQNYLDSLENQPYMQGLLNQPKQTGLSLDQYKEGIAQGLNFGVPEIADAQDALKINKPKTGEEIDLARQGQFNQYPLQTGLSTTPRQGGIIPDMISGFRENYRNSFDPNNLAPQNKNFATRFGEGLGTIARFADSPLGRGLLAYGLNNALGYDDSALEGITAFVGRQNARTADEVYRNNLNKLGIDTSNIRGNVTSDVYKNLADFSYKQQSLQAKKDIAEAKDNVSRARMIMSALNNGTITPQEAQMQMANYGVTLNDVQESNNTRLLPYRQYAMQVAPQVALGNLGVAQGNLGLRQAEFNYQQQQDMLKNMGGGGKPLSDTQVKDIKLMNDTSSELGNIIKTYSDPKYNAGFGIGGAVRRVSPTNKFDPLATKMRQDIDLFRKSVAKAKEGGRLTDQDQKYYDKAVLNPNLSREQFLSLANELKTRLDAQRDNALDMYELQGKNVGAFRNYFNNNGVFAPTQTNNSQIVTKLKNAGYSDEKIQQYLRQKGLQ